MLPGMAGRAGIPLHEAIAHLRAALSAQPAVEAPWDLAHGRVLAADVVARADHPTGDDAALDGVACRVADTVGASDGAPIRLRLVGAVPAGRPFEGRVGAGEAVRVYTGALMPAGADGLVPVERLRIEGDAVWLQRPASGRDVRPRGQALRAGTVAVARGRRLDAHALALAASAGHDRLSVVRAPRLAIVATGDELVAPGGADLAPGQVYESNAVGLAALAREAGADVVAVARARDAAGPLRRRLDEAAASADLVLTAGGVSMGDHDLVRVLLEREGEVGFWRVAIKPGGPVLFGRWRGTPLLGLPGNPVAALVAFWLLGRPALQALEGDAGPAPFECPWPARAGRGLQPAAGRLHVARATLRREGDRLVADAVATQSSGVLQALAAADALALLPPDAPVAPGDPVEVLPLRTTYGARTA
jgi:molybdopterin molybdotransferase